jgi:molybdopterin converting factor small subunit
MIVDEDILPLMTKLRIPTPLRPYVEGRAEILVEGETVAEGLESLAAQYPSLHPHLFDGKGELRAYVNLFVNDEDIRQLQGLETLLQEGDRLMLIPSIAGGYE